MTGAADPGGIYLAAFALKPGHPPARVPLEAALDLEARELPAEAGRALDTALDRARRHVVAVAGHVARASAGRNARALARTLPRLHRAVAIERGAQRAIDHAYAEGQRRARAAG